jgi:Thrombospondin type 1 domain
MNSSWKVGDWETCSASCGGGSQYRPVVCVQAVGDLANVVNNALCKSTILPKPDMVRACNQFKCPEWAISDWSAVSSVTVGTTHHFRKVGGGERISLWSSSIKHTFRGESAPPPYVPASGSR